MHIKLVCSVYNYYEIAHMAISNASWSSWASSFRRMFCIFRCVINFINWVSNLLLSRRNNIKLNFIDIHDHDTRERIFVIIYNNM